MNQLIPLHSQTINGNAIETVSARELHSFVQSKRQFADWIKDRVEKYGFVENVDYITFPQNCGKGRIEKYGFVENVDFLIILSKTPTGGRPI